MNALQILSHWAASTQTAHDKDASTIARTAVIDTLACMLAGAAEESSSLVRTTVQKWGTGPCRVAGGGMASAPFAALANGAAAHALDFDDNDTPAASHPSAVLLPALIALAEERNRDMNALLDAYIVGVEVMGRIGEAVNMAHYAKGWHATATIGSLGAAAACGRLLQLETPRMKAAISIVTSTAGGYKFGTMTKPLHAGLAAKSGVMAASLAEAGVSASDEAIDGKWSFLTLLANDTAPGFKELESRLGKPLAITQYGLSLKRYPCCYYAARSVDAALELRAIHQISPSDIAKVTAEISDRNASILRYTRPINANEARFSLHYCVAAALVRGELTLSDFQYEAVNRPDVQAVLPLVDMRTYAAAANSGDLSPNEPDTVTIHLKSGAKLEKTVVHPRGAAKNPLSGAELTAKFRDCAAVLLEPKYRLRAENVVAHIGALHSVRDLTELLSWPTRQ